MIEQIEGWGECEEESVEDFKKTTKIFANELNYCLKSLSADQDLFTLEDEEVEKFSGSTSDNDRLNFFEMKFSQWITKFNNILNDSTGYKQEP